MTSRAALRLRMKRWLGYRLLGAYPIGGNQFGCRFVLVADDGDIVINDFSDPGLVRVKHLWYNLG